ncbi:M48 family metalloprotease [Ralstonia pickettii]|uniref:M48 family metalloprotease n=1 Tax=Ralstonia pickettii TaxID=329 RepID=UPI0015E1683E|nr:M48 family metalloprotease [Ralstonia pickettii]
MSEAERWIETFASEVGVQPPKLRVKPKMKGCMYNALTHSIVVGDTVLAGSDDDVQVTLAHEVGHVTQRRAIIMDVVPFLVASIFIAAAFCFCSYLALGYFAGHNQVVVAAALASMLALFAIGLRWFERWFEPRYISRELHADAVSAKLCGAAKALALMRSFSTGSAVSAEIRARLEHLEALSRA